MKRSIIITSLLLLQYTCFAQSEFTFNHGETMQKNYFSVISYEKVKGKIIVLATINKRQYRLMLDTGAPTTISTTLYEELKPTIINKLPITDQSGQKDSLFVVSLSDITLGDITFTNITTLVAKQTLILDCFHVDGFIGSNILRNSIVQFQDKNKTVTITNDETKLRLNAKQGSTLFLNKIQSSPFISIKIENKKNASEQLLFDSGMDEMYDLSVKHYAAFEKKNIFNIIGKGNGSFSLGLHGAASDAVQYKLQLPSMKINGVTLNNIPVKTTNGNSSRIGSQLLELGTVTIDYLNKKFYFDAFSKEIDLSEKSFPVDPIFRDNQIQVGIIWDATLNDKMNVGDQIIAIDDIDYENVNLCELMTKESEFKNKEKITLTTRNKTGSIQHTLIEKR